MELEALDPQTLLIPQRDLETIEAFADRNGLDYGAARAWAMKGVIPTVKLGKRRLVNSAQLRQWLLEQEWIR